MHFGDRIKELRIDKKLNQDEFGNIIGLTKASISRLEKSKQSLSDGIINNIIKEFYVNKEWLLNGVGEKYNLELKNQKDFIQAQLTSMGTILLNNITDFLNVVRNSEESQKPKIISALENFFHLITNSKVENHLNLEYYQTITELIEQVNEYLIFISTNEQQNLLDNSIKRCLYFISEDLFQLAKLFNSEYNSPLQVYYFNKSDTSNINDIPPCILQGDELTWLSNDEFRFLMLYKQLNDLNRGNILGRMEMLTENINSN